MKLSSLSIIYFSLPPHKNIYEKVLVLKTTDTIKHPQGKLGVSRLDNKNLLIA